jgi:pimeloyl-ACP methyl ester carboxylesterase
MDFVSGLIETNGARLYYELAGAGPQVTLLHSGIADSRMWQSQFDMLRKSFRVLRYDLRGYGKSPAVPGPFTHTADLAALLGALNIGPTALVGSSKGGTIALDFCLAHPGAVTALVLACTNPSGYTFKGDEPPQWEPMAAAFKNGDFRRAAELEMEIWLVGPQRMPDEVDERIRRLVVAMDEIALRNEAQGGMQEQPPGQPALGRLAEVRIPALVLSGAKDDPNMPAAARFMAAALPDSRLVEFPECAHFPNLEEPERFNRELVEFLREVVK